MKYIIDTHTLVWYFTKDKRLGGKAKSILRSAEQDNIEIIIPIIVLLEALDIQEKKKIHFKIENFLDFIDQKDNFSIAELNFLLFKEMIKIGKGLDLHDRIIIAASKMFQAVILTKDAEIKKLAKTIW
ncbi:PIN domain-containing protein [Candidatus Parcubacteria bacterium]|nr:PIN domain-containing protein [Candidatus Parcubacteria bacterium]MCG2700081.1 PIN domain-containing protein [Candidatus Parcubacteria bacterium]